MEALRTKARELLASGDVKVVIGYAAGSAPDRARPVFVQAPADADKLVLNEHCKLNLAVYLIKPEVRALGKAAVVARPATLRTLLQYAAENQLADGAVVALAPGDDGQVHTLAKFADIEAHVAMQPRGLPDADRRELERLAALPREQRWAYWQTELGRCVKCYACRAACPLCYCERCITDNNQPQWVPVASTPLGNLEWNVVRAMHLAGRCVDCGACTAACPQDIRLDLLNHVLAEEARTQFGAEAGLSTRREYALSTYKPDDKEDFIR